MSTLSLKGDALRRASARLGSLMSALPPDPAPVAPVSAPPTSPEPDRSTALLTFLRAAAPAAFRDPPPPLAIGIRIDIARVATGYSARDVRRALGTWCRRSSYLRALSHGAVRVHLDGSAAGTVSDSHAAFAQEQLAKLIAKERAPQ